MSSRPKGIRASWTYPRRSFIDWCRGLLGLPMREHRGEWKSWRESRRELRTRRTPLPWRRAPKALSDSLDPSHPVAIARSRAMNQRLLSETGTQAAHAIDSYFAEADRAAGTEKTRKPTKAVIAQTVVSEIAHPQ